MTFTQDEEDALKLIAAEFIARKRLDAERMREEAEFRAAWNPLRAEIEAQHKTEMDTRRAAFTAVEEQIKARYI